MSLGKTFDSWRRVRSHREETNHRSANIALFPGGFQVKNDSFSKSFSHWFGNVTSGLRQCSVGTPWSVRTEENCGYIFIQFRIHGSLNSYFKKEIYFLKLQCCPTKMAGSRLMLGFYKQYTPNKEKLPECVQRRLVSIRDRVVFRCILVEPTPPWRFVSGNLNRRKWRKN